MNCKFLYQIQRISKRLIFCKKVCKYIIILKNKGNSPREIQRYEFFGYLYGLRLNFYWGHSKVILVRYSKDSFIFVSNSQNCHRTSIILRNDNKFMIFQYVSENFLNFVHLLTKMKNFFRRK